MMISTKGRYALRVMIDLAEHRAAGYIPLREISERQEISEKYLEAILKTLVQARLVKGLRGKGGGYRLTREPDAYTVQEILTATENSFAPVSCLECAGEGCNRTSRCRTLPMWKKLNEVVNGYLGSVTIADLMIDQHPAEERIPEDTVLMEETAPEDSGSILPLFLYE